MIIDFHTHIFPDKIAKATIEKLRTPNKIHAYSDGTASSLLSLMEKADVDICINLPVLTKIDKFDSVNNFAKELNDTYKNSKRKIISFGAIHPDSENPKELLLKLKQTGFLGIKLHPDYQNTFIDDKRYLKIIEYAKELDLIVVIHAGLDIGQPELIHCTPKMALSAIKSVGGGKIVFAHLGGLAQFAQVEEYLVGQDIYLDTAVMDGFISKEQFVRIVNNHGSDKILFATDNPWGGLSESLQNIRSSDLSEEKIEQILFKNALKLLGK